MKDEELLRLLSELKKKAEKAIKEQEKIHREILSVL